MLEREKKATPGCCSPARDGGRDSSSISEPASTGAQAGRKRSKSFSKRFVELPGGTFLMGTDSNEGHPADREGPVREVYVKPFAISRYAVTNEEFKRFVDATGYVTEAERFGWSFGFHLLVSKRVARTVQAVVQQTPWWWRVDGANWRRPEGPGSTLSGRMKHPVVHVSWHDAAAYAEWAGLRLPTEAEWEYAARGGLVQKRYPWGDELMPDGEHRCNIWQGTFPTHNTLEDGYLGTAPVDAYQPNGYGLYNVVGNVWEWCSDWFKEGVKAMRGGSYLCHESYCNRYRVAARTGNTPDSSSGNIGFRCVADL